MARPAVFWWRTPSGGLMIPGWKWLDELLFGPVLTPRFYTWDPKEDITTYELAVCMNALLQPARDHGPIYDSLPAECRRHFKQRKATGDE